MPRPYIRRRLGCREEGFQAALIWDVGDALIIPPGSAHGRYKRAEPEHGENRLDADSA